MNIGDSSIQIYKNLFGNLEVGINGSTRLKVSGTATQFAQHIWPETTGIYDIGSSGSKWKDGYLSGNLYTPSISNSGSLTITGLTDSNSYDYAPSIEILKDENTFDYPELRLTAGDIDGDDEIGSIELNAGYGIFLTTQLGHNVYLAEDEGFIVNTNAGFNGIADFRNATSVGGLLYIHNIVIEDSSKHQTGRFYIITRQYTSINSWSYLSSLIRTTSSPPAYNCYALFNGGQILSAVYDGTKIEVHYYDYVNQETDIFTVNDTSAAYLTDTVTNYFNN